MKMLSLPCVRAEVERIASKIGASGNILPTFGYSEDFARPHIEVDDRGYHYVIVERGEELRRVTTFDVDELLYQVFADITFAGAVNYELAHRVVGRDARRIMFFRQIELLAKLSPTWATRAAAEHARILREHPFCDEASY